MNGVVMEAKRKLMSVVSSPAKKSRKAEDDTLFDHLPPELVAEIVACVAASSAHDMFNMKLTCKEVYKAAGENIVYQKVSLEELPVVSCKYVDELSDFVKHCEECGNADALYRLGMIQYFSFKRKKEGLKNLIRASLLGHSAARYALGVILFAKDKFKVQGMMLLRAVDELRSKDEDIVEKCRARMKKIMHNIWISYKLPRREHSCYDPRCNNSALRKLQKFGLWSYDLDDDEGNFCNEMCKWSFELDLLVNNY